MAEPTAPLPPPPQRSEPIPWPQPTETPEPLETSPSEGLEELVEEGREKFESAWDDIQRSVSRVVSRAADTIRYLKRERPLEVVAGVAVAAFLLGVTLRIWRSRHD